MRDEVSRFLTLGCEYVIVEGFGRSSGLLRGWEGEGGLEEVEEGSLAGRASSNNQDTGNS